MSTIGQKIYIQNSKIIDGIAQTIACKNKCFWRTEGQLFNVFAMIGTLHPRIPEAQIDVGKPSFRIFPSTLAATPGKIQHGENISSK